jgi:lipoprotein signal peptidase
MPLYLKYLVTAAVVVLVSEIARHYDRVGALIASLPLVTLMVLLWLYMEGAPASKISNHAWYTFWYVLPTLPMFALFPMLMARIGFWPTLAASVLITLVCFGALGLVIRRFGIALW